MKKILSLLVAGLCAFMVDFARAEDAELDRAIRLDIRCEFNGGYQVRVVRRLGGCGSVDDLQIQHPERGFASYRASYEMAYRDKEFRIHGGKNTLALGSSALRLDDVEQEGAGTLYLSGEIPVSGSCVVKSAKVDPDSISFCPVE